MKLALMFGSLAVVLGLVGCAASEDESDPLVEANEPHTNPMAAFNPQPEPPGIVAFNPQPEPPGIVRFNPQPDPPGARFNPQPDPPGARFNPQPDPPGAAPDAGDTQ